MTVGDETISVHGRDTRLLHGGTGQPLLFLHDSWTYCWLPIHDRLATQYHVVVPIHPGFAGSSGFEELDCLEDLVFHYLDLFEVLGLERPILMGASLGGWLAAEFAIRYTGMLRALILSMPWVCAFQARRRRMSSNSTASGCGPRCSQSPRHRWPMSWYPTPLPKGQLRPCSRLDKCWPGLPGNFQTIPDLRAISIGSNARRSSFGGNRTAWCR